MNEDIEKLVLFLERHTELEEEERLFLRRHIEIRSCKKGELLLKEGEVSMEFFFILSGCVRMYYEVEGEEKTAFFYSEDEFVSSYKSFVHRTPSEHHLECIEDCQLAVISSAIAGELLQRFKAFEALARIIMEQELIVYQDIISSFVRLNAEDRYIKFLREKPGLMQRIPLYQLAAFLGVTPETLSRIRKRILNKDIS